MLSNSKVISLCAIAKCANVGILHFIRNYGKVGLLGIPFEGGQHQNGASLGPGAIRKSGIIQQLQAIGNDVKDYGDITYAEPGKSDKVDASIVGNLKNFSQVAACQKEISIKVKEVLDQGYSCLSLGGDHSCGIGTIDGHIKAKKDVSVLWIDAHADLNTSLTTPSGNAHGMPVAFLLKELEDYWPHLPGMDWQTPLLSARNIAYIGLRDVDNYERLIIEKFNIAAYGMEDILRYGIIEVIQQALRDIDPYRNRSLHVSFDIDSLDPLEAPSTGTPVRGGLSLREGIQIMEEVHQTGRLSAVDLVEVNPTLGNEQDAKVTVQAAQHIIKAAFGLNRRGYLFPRVTDIPLPNGS